MMTIYKLNADELNQDFLENLKRTYQHKEIEVAVTEIDETAYLLRSPKNRERLLQALSEVDAGQNVVVPDQGAFQG